MDSSLILESSEIRIKDDVFLNSIQQQDAALANYFSNILIEDKNLTRQLVSFQANKTRNNYRWYKYKEAFSAELVEYLFTKFSVSKGKILDPFAGAGTALFACSDLGYDSEGIEVLPVGQKIIEANLIARGSQNKFVVERLKHWLSETPWNKKGECKEFEVLRITDGAYPNDTEQKIKRYLQETEGESPAAMQFLIFCLLCVLESISFTRKDGQYLRWDHRSGRRNGNNIFDKGKILDFDTAIIRKLKEIKEDITVGASNNFMFPFMENEITPGKINILEGSCLELLPTIQNDNFSGIITSPPYCNRYDYTRTYALELALLGVKERELIFLRQAMLSCTVENKRKELLSINEDWRKAIEICENQILLQEILRYLDYKKERKELNNSGISRMVRGYFYEMACVLQECYRVMKKNSFMFMVNDNVRYAGASISVDMILSKIAEDLGFYIRNILILPKGKGNSSQQMGKHGRTTLRKCVYIWEKRS